MQALFNHEGNVCLVNKGVGIQNLQYVYCGSPFIASFDKQTGKKRFQKNFDKDFGHIIDYTVQGDTLALVFEKSMHFISLKNGTVLSVMDRPDKDDSMMAHFVDKSAYVLNDEYGLVQLNDYPNRSYLYNGRDYVLELDKDWRLIKEIPYSSIYYPQRKLKDHWLMSNEETIITDKNLNVLAQFDLPD